MIIKHKSPAKNTRFNKAGAIKIDAGFLWDGVYFQIDEKSLLRIAIRALRILINQTAGAALAPIEWRTKDNIFHVFQPADFLAFAVAADAYLEQVSKESWAGKDA